MSNALYKGLPVLGFAAFSGTGKTTLLEKVIPLLKERGLRLGLIKASHHRVDPDKPGKDSYRLRHAGLTQTVLSMPGRAMCITERPADDPSLADQLRLLDCTQLDMILVEGFRDADIPKVELHRTDFERPYLFETDANIIALCQDAIHPSTNLPRMDINNPEEVADFTFNFYLHHRQA
ncbi:molybdopterin-guanine dinucleotide biosynthesis protein B [Sansalvadorimonas verongulae]|uniref:molybdopterin-guanine dinucleotide biosynthesis protein B n=1 Tax=Sansalvadorimonas verongulae TaxID=2172824 RepID=UPI0012BB4EF0|nr:molybdopterin-guanine dinucleotide biosynthesis protein B [Sansalvadorimonas verongulae]MTI15425.1 molybdopterin-guanine dinucleotide biosynthesis protein B [Sansalvadorimonas verongulae]